MKKYFFKKGFTMVEILIAITIIGVIAMLVIPPVINNHQQRVWGSRVKKIYSELSNAAKLYMANNGQQVLRFVYRNPRCYGNGISLCSFIENSFKGVEKCASLDSCFGSEYRVDGRDIDNGSNLFFRETSYILPNGTSLSMYTGNNIINIFVDVNNKQKPNRIGRDFFILQMKLDGTISSSTWDGAECDDNYEVCLGQLMNGTLNFDN